MMYLIGQLAIWLLLTALFAALAGWSFAAYQAAPNEERHTKDRDKLVSDLSALASGEARSEGAIMPDSESVRSLTAIREARVAELERALQEQRARADGLGAALAEHQRRLENNGSDADELQRLRAQVAAHEQERQRFVDAEATAVRPPAAEPNAEDTALQGWRLRYFEQRVKFLEGVHAQQPAQPPPAADPAQSQLPSAPPLAEWRVREAEARAQFLADELRRPPAQTSEAAAPAEESVSPFAANADVDTLLRWRMLYLERRVAYLQGLAARPTPAPAPVPELVDAGPDPDRWKWRARYLESRVRHLEERSASAPQALADEAPAAPPAPPPIEAERPPGLPAAQGGAPDDFTLIDAISPLQQTTLYSLGIYHFDQISAWTPANVAWVDRYLRLQGRIGEEEWVEQAADLAREGPEAARRVSEDESA